MTAPGHVEIQLFRQSRRCERKTDRLFKYTGINTFHKISSLLFFACHRDCDRVKSMIFW